MLRHLFQCELVRSVAAARTWPDAYLHGWGEIYTAHPQIRDNGVLFETFLFAPVEILHALRLPAEAFLFAPDWIRCALGLPEADAEEMYAKVLRDIARARLLFEQAGARCANGALIEKLRHNRIKRARHRRRDGEGRLS